MQSQGVPSGSQAGRAQGQYPPYQNQNQGESYPSRTSRQIDDQSRLLTPSNSQGATQTNLDSYAGQAPNTSSAQSVNATHGQKWPKHPFLPGHWARPTADGELPSGFRRYPVLPGNCPNQSSKSPVSPATAQTQYSALPVYAPPPSATNTYYGTPGSTSWGSDAAASTASYPAAPWPQIYTQQPYMAANAGPAFGPQPTQALNLQTMPQSSTYQTLPETFTDSQDAADGSAPTTAISSDTNERKSCKCGYRLPSGTRLGETCQICQRTCVRP